MSRGRRRRGGAVEREAPHGARQRLRAPQSSGRPFLWACTATRLPPLPPPPHPHPLPPLQVPNEASVLFRDRFEAWAARGPVRVEVTTRGFGDAFDGDNKLVYEPESTAAIILGGWGGWAGGGGGYRSLCGATANSNARFSLAVPRREPPSPAPSLTSPSPHPTPPHPTPPHPTPPHPTQPNPPQPNPHPTLTLLVGGDAEAEADARAVCAEAEITAIACDAAPAPAPVFLSATPQSFQRWARDHPGNPGNAKEEQEGGEEEAEGGNEGEEAEEEEAAAPAAVTPAAKALQG
jgi:hypothetical protein